MGAWTEIKKFGKKAYDAGSKIVEDIVNPSHLVKDLNDLTGTEPGEPNGDFSSGGIKFSTNTLTGPEEQHMQTTAYMENGGGNMFGQTTAYDENQKKEDKSLTDRILDTGQQILEGVATSAISNYYNNKQQKAANKFNAEQAELNRQWQTQMANTAHQRELTDLLAAGLNPTMTGTGGGGAATTGGGQGSATTPPYMNGTDISNTALTLAEAMKTINENKYISKEKKAQIANTVADTANKEAGTANTNADTKKIEAETQRVQKEYDLLTIEEQKQLADMIGVWDRAKSEAEKAKVEAWMNSTWVGKFANGAGMTISQLIPILGPIGRFTKSK